MGSPRNGRGESISGRTKRNSQQRHEDQGRVGPGGRSQRHIGAQTDRQTMQMLELIRRMFAGQQRYPDGPPSGGREVRDGLFNAPPVEGRLNGRDGGYPADIGIDENAVHYFGNMGNDWPYDPAPLGGTRDYVRSGQANDRVNKIWGRYISQGPDGTSANLVENVEPYHTDMDGHYRVRGW